MMFVHPKTWFKAAVSVFIVTDISESAIPRVLIFVYCLEPFFEIDKIQTPFHIFGCVGSMCVF
jgi:hypothetical protein